MSESNYQHILNYINNQDDKSVPAQIDIVTIIKLLKEFPLNEHELIDILINCKLYTFDKHLFLLNQIITTDALLYIKKLINNQYTLLIKLCGQSINNGEACETRIALLFDKSAFTFEILQNICNAYDEYAAEELFTYCCDYQCGN